MQRKAALETVLGKHLEVPRIAIQQKGTRDMTETTSISTQSSKRKVTNEELARYGIVCKPVDVFHVGGYRYSNPHDAIAQAKRMSTAKS